MPCASSHFSVDAARENPSKLPREWSPCPPQFAAERNGTVTFDQSGERALWYASSSGCLRISAPKSQRFCASSSSVSVSGPQTRPPCTRERPPRSPAPCCTVLTCMSYQLAQKVERMPPWCVASRYQSAAPSQMHIAARRGGCSEATCHWLMP